MSCKFSFVLIITLCFFTACSHNTSESGGREEVIFNDGYKSDEVTIEDKDFIGKDGMIPVSDKSTEEITKVEDDNSKISILTDRYGNKTETRTFNLDPRLSLIVLRTSADGQKQVFVYGQNGEVKSVPENMWDKLLTAKSEEIAAAANIEAIRQTSSSAFAQNQSPSTEMPLQPLPSSNFPIQRNQISNVSDEATDERQAAENKVNSVKPDEKN